MNLKNSFRRPKFRWLTDAPSLVFLSGGGVCTQAKWDEELVLACKRLNFTKMKGKRPVIIYVGGVGGFFLF